MFGLKRLRPARTGMGYSSSHPGCKKDQSKLAQRGAGDPVNKSKISAIAGAVAGGNVASSSFSMPGDIDNTVAPDPSAAESNSVAKETRECIICFDDCDTWFTTADCAHTVCRDCMDPYLRSFIDTAKVDYTRIPCPNVECEHAYDAEHIVYFAAAEPIAWWRTVLERTQMETMGVCPYEDCKAVFELEKDSALSNNPEENMPLFGECLECHRGLCIRCEEKWHSGKCKKKPKQWQRPQHASLENTEEERKQKEKLLELAKNNGWARCPEYWLLCDDMSMRAKIKCYNLTKEEIDAIRKTMFEQETIV
ncbi:hypothetical protein BX666DRAFT_2026759 [Dichotomocladium elegans]|nr:hypothetical protein BX666DRAFT_2026759 [Dichotomocladium elegans]